MCITYTPHSKVVYPRRSCQTNASIYNLTSWSTYYKSFMSELCLLSPSLRRFLKARLHKPTNVSRRWSDSLGESGYSRGSEVRSKIYDTIYWPVVACWVSWREFSLSSWPFNCSSTLMNPAQYRRMDKVDRIVPGQIEWPECSLWAIFWKPV